VVLVDQRGDQRGVLFAGGTQLGDRAPDGRRKVVPGVVEPDARVVVVRGDAKRVGLASATSRCSPTRPITRWTWP
jgi:hypothetical protein